MQYTITRSQLIKTTGCPQTASADWIDGTYSEYFRFKREGKNVLHDPFDVYILAFIHNQLKAAKLPPEKVKEDLESLNALRYLKEQFTEIAIIINRLQLASFYGFTSRPTDL
ncbi:hypothetical protein EDD69_11236 [Thermolongibacillus altinsuensis]|uniref:Uncharacterized protein n=1 Tax=Thermolongibacillus altinsuensis TaxID=575256 RepID=A0A4R1QK51_9BACL|nr:hypothetical protein [Thermolongibacillus altinsuensis]TCL47326.1 hypothetical protein EDD69_11236 [Thermolongibacillus altinsuensis]